ncbi:MAG: polyprenyl synthetase family protein [Cytophagales bacterium]
MIATQETLLKEIEKAIDKIEYSIHVESLVEPIKYILSLGGKRMRPMLVLNAYKLFKDDFKSVIKHALAVEVFHNFTLMHDDIMDEAPIRRGKPTVHVKMGVNTAILSGDAMLIQSYEMFKDLVSDKLSKVLSKFNRCAIDVCEGQQLDMLFEKKSIVSVDEYLHMISLKTAVLLGFSLELGAILADAPEKDAELLYNIGLEAGIGFQIMDDYLDLYGEASKVGKQVGGDVLINKKTFLLCNLLNLASTEDLTLINAWLEKKDFKAEEKINFFKNQFEKYEIPTLTQKAIEEKYKFAIESVSQLNADRLKKGALKKYLSAFMGRES